MVQVLAYELPERLPNGSHGPIFGRHPFTIRPSADGSIPTVRDLPQAGFMVLARIARCRGAEEIRVRERVVEVTAPQGSADDINRTVEQITRFVYGARAETLRTLHEEPRSRELLTA